MRPRSLHASFIIGSVLWTLGLLGFSHLLFVYVTRYAEHVLRLQHWSVVAILGAVFMLGGLTQVRRGLSPIRQLRQRLASLADGTETRVEGQYPSEVQPLVDDLNALLADREARVARAVTRAGDLAHGLKTPLAVLAHEADRARREGQGELAAAIAQQVERMRRQVDSHLAQARVVASGAMPGARTVVSESAEGLARVLARLHAERALDLVVEVPETLAVRVPREDLDEMLGNLLDNACRAARKRVRISSVADGSSAVLAVEDDGPGLDPSLWDKVLQRGVTADETAPGSGLGLAITRDLAELYGGSVHLSASAPLGGLKAELRLPALAAHP